MLVVLTVAPIASNHRKIRVNTKHNYANMRQVKQPARASTGNSDTKWDILYTIFLHPRGMIREPSASALLVFFALAVLNNCSPTWGWNNPNIDCRGHKTYKALVGSMASLHGYLNQEFNQMVVELTARHRWNRLPPSSHTRSTKLLVGEAHGSWPEIESRAIAVHGHTPSALLFIVKFHWNYRTLVNLGPRLPHHLPGTNM
jgi:hypothetical protein